MQLKNRKPLTGRYIGRKYRAVIGLHHLGVRDMTVFAKALGLWLGRWHESDPDTDSAAFYVAEVIASDNPTVKMWLRFGLPHDASAKLSASCQVRCPRCGATVSCVPCRTCAALDCGAAKKKRKASGVDDGTDAWLERWINDGESPEQPELPTEHEPGSAGKVEVMASRFATGQDIHHPEDVKCFYEHGNGSSDMFPSVFASGFSAYREELPVEEQESADDDDLL